MTFVKARAAYQQDDARVAAVTAWQRGETPGIGTEKPSVFQRIMRKIASDNTVPRTVLAETSEFVVIMPGGTSWTWGGINPPCQRTGNDRALMSLVHVLVIPKERIYNAVSLETHHLPLLERMQTMGQEVVRRLADGPPELECSAAWMARGGYAGPDGSALQSPDPHVSVLPGDMSQDPPRREIVSAFHVEPHQSQDWLHMHVFSGPHATDGFDLHVHKNTAVSEVCSVLRQEAISHVVPQMTAVAFFVLVLLWLTRGGTTAWDVLLALAASAFLPFAIVSVAVTSVLALR
jgi:hypothetical protein